MALNANNIIATERNLKKIILPKFDLVVLQKKFISNLDDEQKKSLVGLATASVSETIISSYLNVLAKDRSINKLCWMTVDAHRRDELAHANLFTGVMKKIFHKLNRLQQDYYLSMLPCAVKWFDSNELRVWEAVLKEIKFPGYKNMLSDIRHTKTRGVDNIDYSGVVKLGQQLDRDVTPFFYQQNLEMMR
jgi:hypothetical protein